MFYDSEYDNINAKLYTLKLENKSTLMEYCVSEIDTQHVFRKECTSRKFIISQSIYIYSVITNH